jgi:hypoxanthine phosphoribosyltransferase
VDVNDVKDEIDEVLIDAESLQIRVQELADQISADYRGEDLLFVGVLKGAVMVMADLARAMPFSVEMDWMAVASYGGRHSSGVVRILKDLDVDVAGRHVVVVEDIVDSGLTLSWLVRNLSSRRPASLEVCAMVSKPEAVEVEVDIKYIGFEVPDQFVVGYGLDYRQKYRNLRQIATLRPNVYE